MFEEDFPLPGFKTPTESYIFWQLVVLIVFASWSIGGAIYWSPPYVITLGLVGMLFFYMHQAMGPDMQFTHSYKRYPLMLIPVWVAGALGIMGLYNNPLQEIIVGKETFFTLAESSNFFPSNSTPIKSWVPILLKSASLIAALNLIYIAESHYMLRRLLVFLCANAMILACLGYMAKILNSSKILGFISPASDAFFATFSHPNHWGAFALLWSTVIIGLVAHMRRRQSWKGILQERGVLLAVGAIILFSTLFIAPSPIYLGLFGIVVCCNMLHTAWYHLKWDQPNAKKKIKACLLIILGLIIGLFSAYSTVNHTLERDYALTQAAAVQEVVTDLTLSQRISLYQDSLAAFMEKPLFGWGGGSFSTVMSFYQNADIGSHNFESAHSDLLESLVENGIVGTLIWWIVPVFLLYRFCRLKIHRMLSYYLFAACAVVGLAAFIDFPFQNPAVLVSFWVVFVCAYRWSETAIAPTPVHGSIVFSEKDIHNTPERLRKTRKQNQ